MATFTKIGTRWRAQIRKAGRKSTSKTFGTKAEAMRWAAEIENSSTVATKLTVADLIKEYREQKAAAGRPIGKTSNTHYMLKNLASDEFGLGPVRVEALQTDHLVKYCQARLRTVAAGTANMEITQLGTVLRHTKSLLNLRLGDVVGDARPTLRHYGLIGTGTARTRRPTAAELSSIYKALEDRPRLAHLRDILTIALITGMRRGEICRIRWLDLDDTRKTVVIRDRKHPTQKQGNDQEIPLIGAAWGIIQAQPRKEGNGRIFPYSPVTVSNRFTDLCKDLGIEDLRLHDMRHEAVSALFEAGWQIPEVAAVSGHKDWRQLKRYTQIEPASLHGKVVPLRKAG
ncbi:site-specific integrase [Parapusillimonas sp. JC17]|uniref:site-specific integrase n=1 Tax=Parapusillimonas sp. JC17 TaxID=3445768 RepID=UPI003FA0B31F